MAERPHGDPEKIVRQLLIAELGLDPERVEGYPGIDTVYVPHHVAVTHSGGPSDHFEQHPTLDVEVFATTRAEAKRVSYAIELLMLRYPWSIALGPDERWVVDSVTCDIRPRTLPWDDESVRRTGAQYTLSLRR